MPSRGWPTEPSTACQRLSPCKGIATSVTGTKAVILASAVTLNSAGLWVWPQNTICASVERRLRDASSTVST